MATIAPPRSRTRWRTGPLAALATVAAVLLLSACTPEQWDALTRLNSTRAEYGLSELRYDETLALKAQTWADQLATQGYLAHSILPAGVQPGWSKLAENVGSGASIESVHAGFVASPLHMQNLLDPEFNYAGTGVATSPTGVVYVVQVFARF